MTQSKRKGDWFLTNSGVQFWPLDCRVEDIVIEDIAHGLSNICRYGGHCDKFYSVAQHSIFMANQFDEPRLRLWALLHDASEAYIADVVRPLKPFLQNYEAIESDIMMKVAERFNLDPLQAKTPKEVKDVDNRILVDEMDQLMPNKPKGFSLPFEPLGINIFPWGHAYAKQQFMETYQDIMQHV